MNKQKPGGIGWCDYTWNPVTGCWGAGGTAEKPNRCWYCYAHKINKRFREPQIIADYGMIKIHGPELEEPFIPKFWLDRLVQPAKVKKPSKIFVGSMGDLFGDWVPEDWIIKVIGTAWFVAPHHTYIFLTKNPARYADFNPWPSNCWLLTTITCQKDADERIPELLKAQGPVLGVSLEPLLGPVDLLQAGGLELYTSWDDRMEEWDGINWLIIGAMTGPGSKQHQPKPEWIQSLIDQARAAGVSLFIKDNVNWTEKTQEWPGGLTQHR